MTVTVQEVERLLASANPWWVDDAWAERDKQLLEAKAAPFTYEPKTLHSLVEGSLYFLRGPRRAGKSTLMKRKIQELISSGIPPRSIVHFSVEGWTAGDLEELIRQATGHLRGEPGTCYWFIDEVTSVNGTWPSALKRQRDQNPQFAQDTVVVAGSSAARLDQVTKDLAGRRGRATRTNLLLLQMPFCEVARALGVSLPAMQDWSPAGLTAKTIRGLVDELQPWQPALLEAWAKYLTIGGYPQAVAEYLRSGVVGPDLSETLFEVVHGDALLRSNLAPVQTNGILRGITRSLSSLLSVGSVAREVGVAQSTATARLEDLRLNFLAYPVSREQGLGAKPGSQAKWYFTDPQLARLASSRGAGPAPGVMELAEQQLSLVLLQALERSSLGAALSHDQLFYYRSSTGAEIDFVAAAFDGVCFESKYTDGSWGRAFQTIEASPYKLGVVATRSGTEKHRAGWALPAPLLAVILGA